MVLRIFQELENHLHSQKTSKQEELREIAQRLISSEVLAATVSSELSAYELRCNTLVTQVCHCINIIIIMDGFIMA